MGITKQFDDGMIQARVQKFQENLENAVLFVLKYLGESLVKYARDNHNYTDQTGNLTNSISYAIVRNSKIVYSDEQTQPGEGAEAAKAVAIKYASTLPNSFSLIIVAGMNYAAYVESKGYNVILPAELKAKTEVPRMMNRIIEQAKEKANNLFGTAL